MTRATRADVDAAYSWGQRALDETRRERDELRAENERLRAALQRVRDREGRVCDEYELCEHRACASSYNAWAIADAALHGTTPEETNQS